MALLKRKKKPIIIWKTQELIKYRCRNIHEIFAKKIDTQKPELVKKFVERYLLLTTDELSDTWNRGMPLLNRLLWANLESLPTSLFEKMLIKFTNEEFLLCATYDKLERINKLNSRRASPTNFNKLIELVATKYVHNGILL